MKKNPAIRQMNDAQHPLLPFERTLVDSGNKNICPRYPLMRFL
ncbi:MAG TPA: hypothetical protein PLJ00_03260 [Chitinophagales bacterium]|nr:hypothetical protein [Chitinophagales bacterium]HRG26885.1 hypothetical protein [Chitinophagales bacterium]HRG85225.1 hypothetical protein [Chitinophagales bacterium]HRH51821.1 hypothetical protein [Chitinophagales bacterium]